MERVSEKQIQKAILEYLAVRGILAYRMQTGSTIAEYKGKTRRINYGTLGMADILAFPHAPVIKLTDGRDWIINGFTLWIECKTRDGRQSELQKSFQRQVEQHGHLYIIARSIDDVAQALSQDAR